MASWGAGSWRGRVRRWRPAGGRLGATLIAIFFIPLFFVLLERFSERFFPPAAKARAAVRPSPVAPGEE